VFQAVEGGGGPGSGNGSGNGSGKGKGDGGERSDFIVDVESGRRGRVRLGRLRGEE
jgi:hypothetical protein